jgi:hypothetical protein
MAPKVRPIINAELGKPGRRTGAGKRVIALKLAHPELSDAKIAARVGCAPSNVHTVLSRFLGDHSQTDLKAFQESKAEIFDALQMRMLASITQQDIAKAPLLPKITGAAILEDKARIIRGQATGINAIMMMDVVEALKARQAQTDVQVQSNQQRVIDARLPDSSANL